MKLPEVHADAGTPTATPTATYTATLGRRTVGTLRTHADGDVLQVLWVEVDNKHRRQGIGSLLLDHALTAARPRRAWCLVAQGRDVIARAWLTKHGFNHVTTVEHLHDAEDGLIYVRTFD